jgi:hypothetical protein
MPNIREKLTPVPIPRTRKNAMMFHCTDKFVVEMYSYMECLFQIG